MTALLRWRRDSSIYSFEPVEVDGWNPVVTSYDVKDAEGNHLGLFMMDKYARDSKRGGAWMSSYRNASKHWRRIHSPDCDEQFESVDAARRRADR